MERPFPRSAAGEEQITYRESPVPHAAPLHDREREVLPNCWLSRAASDNPARVRIGFRHIPQGGYLETNAPYRQSLKCQRCDASFRLDAGLPDDRPPFFDLGLLVSSKGLWRLLFPWENFHTEIG
jgi:hypothetical protein